VRYTIYGCRLCKGLILECESGELPIVTVVERAAQARATIQATFIFVSYDCGVTELQTSEKAGDCEENPSILDNRIRFGIRPAAESARVRPNS